MKQMGLAEAFADPRLGRNERLAKIAALIDWSRLARFGFHRLRSTNATDPTAKRASRPQNTTKQKTRR